MTANTKTALVTGSNRGIGLAIAKGLLAKDYQVLITARSLTSAQETADTLKGNVIPLQLDVSDDHAIKQSLTTVSQSIGHLDVLVNNAGVLPDDGVNILTIPRDRLETAMNTNAFGVIQMVQACLPLLKQSKEARIINVSSGMGAFDGLTGNSASYCLSKLALNGATILLADALRSQGIAVNAMCPGWVRTDMGGSSAPRSPEQGADTAIWLATEAPASATGKFWRDRQTIAF